jgi:iron complex transport system substrate-binding protein
VKEHDIMNRSTSRAPVWAVLLVAVAALASLLFGCGDDVDTASGSATDDPAASRTVTHRFGTIEVPADPQRIVAVGSTDADALAVLGIVPVAAYPNTGFGEGRFFPWLDSRPEVAETEPLALDPTTYGVNAEQIAALRPDLIIAVNSYNNAEEQYELLSAIAPTLSASADPVTMTWQEHAMEIADALGRRDDMEAVSDAIDARIAEIAADNPSFAGASLSFGGVFSPTEATMVFGEDDYSRVFLGQLGFTIPERQLEELPALAGNAGENVSQAPVSLERLDLLDADVLVLAYLDPAVAEEFTARDVFQAIPVVADGRYFEADAGIVAGLRIPSVLAIPYVLDSLVPDLQAALA